MRSVACTPGDFACQEATAYTLGHLNGESSAWRARAKRVPTLARSVVTSVNRSVYRPHCAVATAS